MELSEVKFTAALKLKSELYKIMDCSATVILAT